MADRLQVEVDGKLTLSHEDKRPVRSVLETFSLRLVEYYQQNYVHLPTMGESLKHVRDVWVPLQFDGRIGSYVAADPIDHTELLSRLKSNGHRNMALIKGDPGTGKATLSKMIAYDWAINYSSNGVGSFKLVLAVPLKSATGSLQLEQIAIEYFISIGRGQLIKGIDKAALVREINALKLQLLVVLDGLDEYGSFGESLLKDIFAPPFTTPSVSSTVPLPMINFKLIITSRPYACKFVNKELSPLGFVIMPIDRRRMTDFLQLYCQTSHGVEKVKEYLKVNAQTVQVPLILSYVCYLADAVEEIPTNITSLYLSLIRQMLRRENEQKRKLKKSVNTQMWKQSKVAKSTGELGFQGSVGHKLEFDGEYLKKCRVTNDSFICGFLLHKLDLDEGRLMAEFPHRSMQEFFAALHCYLVMLSGRYDSTVMEMIRKLIHTESMEVGRFFFGICSKEVRFDRMIRWLNPSLGTSDHHMYQPAEAINGFTVSLIDCSTEERQRIGQLLFESAARLEVEIADSSCQYLHGDLRQLQMFSSDFIEALHIVSIPAENSHGNISEWYLADNSKSIRLAVVGPSLTDLLDGKFEQIDILIWGYVDDSLPLYRSLCHIKSLPPVRTLLLTMWVSHVVYPISFVTIRIRYSRTCDSILRNFQVGFSVSTTRELMCILDKKELVSLKVDKQTVINHNSLITFRQLHVTVDDDVCQSSLIWSLIRLSLLDHKEKTDQSRTSQTPNDQLVKSGSVGHNQIQSAWHESRRSEFIQDRLGDVGLAIDYN